METLISVCIPVYNASLYLRECIDSILSQGYKNFELLIVDDGSTDNSSDIVRSYNDTRIRFIQNSHDYIGSLNLLLKEAKGTYIARMDADDCNCYATQPLYSCSDRESPTIPVENSVRSF